MIQWDMVQEGDRLLLGLSGGKDSLSLLHVLLEYQKKVPIKFDIEVCTIDPMTPSFDPSPLIPYVEGLGLKYHYIRDDSKSVSNTSNGLPLMFVLSHTSKYYVNLQLLDVQPQVAKMERPYLHSVHFVRG
jgi:hypothetical protein